MSANKNSIIAFPKDYVVLDLETTGLSIGDDEIIEIGMIRVRDRVPTETYTSFVKPDRFDCIPEFITELTGITNEMMAGAPAFASIEHDIESFIGEDAILGHNVSFDLNFLKSAFEKCGKAFKSKYIDTMRISRKLYKDWEHHRLSDLIKNLSVEIGHAHRALDDAIATQKCYEIMRDKVAEAIGEDVFIKSFSEKFDTYKRSLEGITSETDDIDETNPIYGKVVVFTGALSSMGRKEALQIVANLGGIPSDSLTKKTNFLVVGNKEFVKSVKDGKTNKMKKADSYASDGLDIVTMSENSFFTYISDYINS